MNTLDRMLRAKIPSEETGIEIKRTICDICTPGPQCGVDAYVKDGVVIKVEGTDGFPTNNGALCTKGAANRQYIYREDRIRTPMRRVGNRGDGEYEPISWDQAIKAISEGLNKTKAKYGAESVVFMTGYPKWYRPWLERLAYSFGSPNYITESSTCHRAEVMSWKLTYGVEMRPDIANMPDVLVGWSCNPLVSAYPMGRNYYKYKEQGGKVVIIDPRRTPTAVQCADLYIRPRVGTDGYLANTVARLIVEKGWADMDFIESYTHGFKEYKDMLMTYSLDEAERITGVPAKDIMELARLIGTAKKAVVIPSNGLCHHSNGITTHRAVICLNALTGNVAKPGTFLPTFETFVDMLAGFKTLEEEFRQERFPKNARPKIGSDRFPIWSEMVDEAQGMDLLRHWQTKDPYPIKAIYAHGVNNRMYPQSSLLLEMAKDMEFVVATDIFWTDFCKHADIVLPACTSFERSEVKCYNPGYIVYTTPAIEPLYESLDDVEIITWVAQALNIDDELLCSGYDACVKYIYKDLEVDLDEVKAVGTLIKIPVESPPDYLKGPINTPSGKIEFYSEAIAKYKDSHGMNPLPVFEDGFDCPETEDLDMALITGGRITNAVHSRLHDVPWLRSLRPEPAADINPKDAEHLGIVQGDDIYIVTRIGRIKVKANISAISAPGEVNIYHGYKEANINEIIPRDHLDPYSGFPGFKQIRCRIEKAEV
ncbi:MAG: molybdopterin-dependent oxidoreductase [Clostridiales bacterium]|nr:molybdopterin-dependent oxidoreductase [Clostridiales bacterium]